MMVEIEKRYKKCHERTRESMDILIRNIGADNVEQYILLMDILAVQYDLMYSSIENLRSSECTIPEKSKAINMVNTCSNNIFRILSLFPTSPMVSRKIRKLDGGGSSVDVKDYLDKLME